MLPVLDLSGPRLREHWQRLAVAGEEHGGIERYVAALAWKSRLFADLLGGGRVRTLREDDFNDLCVFISPVRRRIAGWRAGHDFAEMLAALALLFDGWQDTATTDARMAAFLARFPADRRHRWVRDLAAELLHYAEPQLYPLMTRWMWDRAVNAGVLREIWFGDIDRATIEVADDYACFLALRQELSQFLADNGVYRDMPFHVDLLCAHVYGAYVEAQGGSLLRADFSAPADPMVHTRRMLGLDGLDTETGRTRLKLIDGRAYVIDDARLLP